MPGISHRANNVFVQFAAAAIVDFQLHVHTSLAMPLAPADKTSHPCRSGFNEVFPLDALKCFFEDEIEAMMCGTGEKWTVETLTDTIKFDHGYTATSTAVGFFLDILTELDAADQRRFLRFVTGSPRLPPGGIAALHPR